MPETKQQKKAKPLPGDPDHHKMLERMIRVDHAGEFGAARIYEGQLAVFGKSHPLTPTIQHMAEQEQEHLDAFNRLLIKNHTRPTLLGPIWHAAGYALGAATALMGERAAMACTAAVEEVIDQHYESQKKHLEKSGEEPALRKTIEKFQADEVEHRDIAINHNAEKTPGYRILSSLIKAGCRTAIWASKRI